MTNSRLYEIGSGLEVPGIEGKFEYGDADTSAHDRIPGALLINDHSKADQVRVTEISGLHDDPEISDSRTERASHWGERAGILMPRGRTVGLTGRVQSGNVNRMRDLWRRMRGQFGRDEGDFVIHTPNEAQNYVNHAWSRSITGWQGSAGGTLVGPTTFTDGTLSGISLQSTSSSVLQFSLIGVTGSGMMVPWSGEDVWLTAIVKPHSAPATFTSIALGLVAIQYDPSIPGIVSSTAIMLTGTGIVTSPATGTYVRLSGRISPSTSAFGAANYVVPVITAVNPATSGAYVLRAAQVGMVLLNADEPSPVGYFGGDMPGFEYSGAAIESASSGPAYLVNQISNPDSTTSIWANDSTSGATVDVAGVIDHSWPGDGVVSNAWTIHNPSTTSRTLAIRYPVTLSDPGLFIVAGGRSYRAHVRARVSEMFTTGVLSVVWLDRLGSAISTTTVESFDAVATGGIAQDVDLDGVVQAPSLAMRAYLRIASSTASTTSGNKMALLVAEPRFFDASEFDPGADVAIDSTLEPEHGIVLSTASRSGPTIIYVPAGARRRIPRPFLLRKVRSIWDGKAPESQRNLQASRDFTMSLRAADPRIYTLDERHINMRASSPANAVSFPMSSYQDVLDEAFTTAASDDFTGTTAFANLGTRTAPLGGAWSGSGDSVDYYFEDLSIPVAGNEALVRSQHGSTIGRFAILGTSVFTNVQVDLDVRLTLPISTDKLRGGVVARYVDTTNYVRAWIERDSATPSNVVFGLTDWITGTETANLEPLGPVYSSAGFWHIRLIVYASGHAIAQLYDDDPAGGVLRSTIEMRTPHMAPGGAIQSGKCGIWDFESGANDQTRFYDNFVVSVPHADPYGPPPNFTSDSSYNALDQSVRWRDNSLGGAYPLDGMALSPSETMPPTSGYLSQDSVQRDYYSFGAITYTTPQVTVSGNCIDGTGFDYDLFADSLIGGAWQYNYIGALVKRVSATTWLEARYNSANRVAMNAAHASPTAPQTLELWSSHNTSGTLSTTLLASWDVPVANIIDGHRKHLRAYIDTTNTVYVELWDFDGPNPADTGLIARHSFLLGSSLISLYGAGVGGSSGLAIKLARWDNAAHAGISVDTMRINYDMPYIATFDAIDYSSPLLFNCPVIGDADDVPLKLQLRGDIDTPTIVWSNVDTGKFAILKLSGIFSEDDPATVDMDSGTIKTATGLDLFERRMPGSRFFNLQPGQNIITVYAIGWDIAAPAHVIASWRDALK